MSELNVIDLVDGNAWEPGADGYIIKAGQGQLEYRWRPFVGLAEAAARPWGLYWVPDPRYSPESQKAAIKAAFPAGNFGRLGLWLDVEKPWLSMTDAEYRAMPYPYYKPIESIWRGIYAYSGIWAGWYFSPGSWDLILGGMPADLQAEIAEKSNLWIAHHYAQVPTLRGKWTHWQMWQWRGEPDYNHVDLAWWEAVNGPQVLTDIVLSRPRADYEICFTQGIGELPLLSVVEHAAQLGAEICMNGGAGFEYTDATHAIPKVDGFQQVEGIPYARRLVDAGVINPDLDDAYKAPWSILGFDASRYFLIVTRGLEGSEGRTQREAALFVRGLGILDAYLMDSGKSSAIAENGLMIYWPYGPSEKVPQAIGIRRKSTGGVKVKGVAKTGTTSNIKALAGGSTPVAYLTGGQVVYGNDLATDIGGFDHLYMANGSRVELGQLCKVTKQNLIVTNEDEPDGGTPPSGGGSLPATIEDTAVLKDDAGNVLATYKGILSKQ